jgi:hypothetical protein
MHEEFVPQSDVRESLDGPWALNVDAQGTKTDVWANAVVFKVLQCLLTVVTCPGFELYQSRRQLAPVLRELGGRRHLAVHLHCRLEHVRPRHVCPRLADLLGELDRIAPAVLEGVEPFGFPSPALLVRTELPSRYFFYVI